MTRPTILIVMAVLLAGCRAPLPKFNPFAPYGSARVPPPPTGRISANGNYYQPAPQAGASSSTGAWRTNASTGQVTDLSSVSLAPPADRNEAVRVAEGQRRAGIRASEVRSPSFQSQLQGMPVTDATGLTQPSRPMLPPPPQRQGGGMMEITDLPQATPSQRSAFDST